MVVNMREKVSIIENCMDLEEGTLQPNDKLSDYEEWDSLTVLSIIAAVDEKYRKNLTGEDLRKAVTVEDVAKLMG